MRKIKLLIIILLVSFPTFGQVGINTTDPQEALHVNGKIRVNDISGRSSVSVVGVDATGTLNTMRVGGALEVHNNTIIASGTGYYSVINIPITTPTPNTKFHNLDLNVIGANAYKTVIRFIGQTQSFDISGIQGGVEGRHIILLNPNNVNMGVLNDSNSSIATNRIITYGSGPGEATSGQGAIELVYDGTRWVVLNLRN